MRRVKKHGRRRSRRFRHVSNEELKCIYCGEQGPFDSYSTSCKSLERNAWKEYYNEKRAVSFLLQREEDSRRALNSTPMNTLEYVKFLTEEGPQKLAILREDSELIEEMEIDI